MGIYALSVSHATISSVTDKLIPELKQWRQRPLESHYPFIWLDAIHYKVKADGRYDNQAVYTVLGLNLARKNHPFAKIISYLIVFNRYLLIIRKV